MLVGNKLNTLIETNWLKKRIAEYNDLIKAGTLSMEEAQKRIDMLESRLNELEKEALIETKS